MLNGVLDLPSLPVRIRPYCGRFWIQTAERVRQRRMTNQPAVEAELAPSLAGSIGNREFLIGPEEMDRAALAIRRKQFGPESPEAAASLNELGWRL